jgi:hypothetical protein
MGTPSLKKILQSNVIKGSESQKSTFYTEVPS